MATVAATRRWWRGRGVGVATVVAARLQWQGGSRVAGIARHGNEDRQQGGDGIARHPWQVSNYIKIREVDRNKLISTLI